MQPQTKPQRSSQPPFPLAMSEAGETVRIATVRRGRILREKLHGLGIQVGDVVEVVQRRENGAVLIAKDENRYALGGGMAHKIHVVKEI